MSSMILASSSFEDWQVHTVAVEAMALKPSAPCREALEMFEERPEIFGLAVVQNGQPCGLLSRIPLMTTFARPNLRDLYERRPVALLMDSQPLVVDAETSLTELSALIYRLSPHALTNGFIVTKGRRYLGIGNGLDLLRRVAELAEQRSREVQGALRQAMNASAAKSQFLAHMSHELRTPLNAVLGFSEIIAQEALGPNGNTKYREYAEDIHSSASHLLSLINDVLDLSKAEAGRLELDLRPVDLAAVGADCLRLFQLRAKGAGLGLECRIPAMLPLALADERKIRQIALNLLSNAVKFTPEGGHVTLELAFRAPATFRLTVADTGIGMAPGDIGKALSPFGQISNGLTRKYPGTGLGLSMTKMLVELHGGSIRLDSAPGAGTTVTVDLPILAADCAEPEEPPRAVAGLRVV